MGDYIQKTAHFRHRSVTRSFSDDYIDLLEAHGDYVDQEGSCYALVLEKDMARELQQESAQELRQQMHEMKMRRRRCKKLGLSVVRSPKEIIKSNEE